MGGLLATRELGIEGSARAEVTASLNAVSLTEREIEVLRHVGRGRRNKEIGSLIGISVPTVKNHLTSAVAKLRARSRTQAVVRAVQLRILNLDELDPTPIALRSRLASVSASAYGRAYSRRKAAV